MSKFKVGDRVAVYGFDVNSAQTVYTGVVDGIDNAGILAVMKSDGDDIICHPKQCRRLKPRAPLREFWLTVNKNEHSTAASNVYRKNPEEGSIANDWEVIHVREVRPARKERK